MKREAVADKVLVLGVDALDPLLTRKYVDMGIMPNTKKIIEAGAQRHDLVMLGGHPTVTPPMWTTLATGAYANTHGITGYYRKGSDIDKKRYNFDSRLCMAEQVWNCLAEAGKKTLVWHWPGSSWPPSSDSENLYVVDGTSPGAVGMSVAQLEDELIVGASEEIQSIVFAPHAAGEAAAACIVRDLDLSQMDDIYEDWRSMPKGDQELFIYSRAQQTVESPEYAVPDLAQSPIKAATGWADAPADAKEFVILLSRGLIRRPALILKNAAGIYDKVAVYKNKKSVEPIVVLEVGKMVAGVVDEAFKKDVKYEKANRNFKLLKLAEDGSSLSIYVAPAMDMTNDSVWHPKRLFKEVTENVGFPPGTSMLGAQDATLINECMLDNWNVAAEWQSESILHLIETENLDAVFSHFHNVDLQIHQFIQHRIEGNPYSRVGLDEVEKWTQDLYMQTDRYIGKFAHLIDEGWTMFIVSDHSQVPATYEVPCLVDMEGITVGVMEELGYTVPIRDEQGAVVAIDWTKTRAVMQREGHLYLNIRGRNQHVLADGTVIDGIVDPADQYELEEQIMTDLYSLKHKDSGHRFVSVAFRNREAVLLGQGGPEAGDICVWHAEGYNYDHSDGLATVIGKGGDTTLSPIFIAAGKGIKKGFETDRVIREVDLAPTVAALCGVRMPAQCEGAPVYQIFEEEF